MRIDIRTGWIALVLAGAAGCGGGSDDPPTTNTNQTAASLDLTISGTSPITAIGDTRTLTVTTEPLLVE